MEGLANWIGDLFGGSSGSNMSNFATGSGLTDAAGKTFSSQAGDTTQLLGRGIDAGLAGSLTNNLKGLLGDFDIMDLGKLGLGYMGMQEQKKTNKKNNTLLDQNIAENDRITLAREDLKRKFAEPTGLAAMRTS